MYRILVFSSRDHANPNLHPRLYVEYTCSGLGIDDITKNDISIFPNPASEFISIEIPDSCSIEVFDVSGTKISEELLSNARMKQINDSNLIQGMYISNLTHESKFEKNIVIE